MIRTILSFILLTAALQAGAATIKAEVVSTTIGVKDWEGQPTLCVVVARHQGNGELMGLVEDITDCYWTRQARRQKILNLPSNAFAPVQDSLVAQHLQGFDSQLEFFWSTAD